MSKELTAVLAAVVLSGLLSAAAVAAEKRPETEMEAAVDAAKKANVDLPSDLQLKYVWSLPLKAHIVDPGRVWIIGDYVVAVSRDRYLHLIRRADGVALWVVELEDMPMYDPVITSQALYVVVKNRVVAIHLTEGEVVWRLEPDFAVSSAPVVKEPDFYIGGWDKRLHALELRSTERVYYKSKIEEETLRSKRYYFFKSWHLTTKGHVSASPQEFENFIYFPSEDGHLYSISRDGDVRYAAATQGPIKSAATIRSDKAFVGSSDFSLYCFNRLTGSEIWHFPTGADVFAQPYVDKASNMVYCPSNNNGVFGVDERSGSMVWQIEDAEEILGVSKDVIYLGLRHNRLLAVEKTTGTALWISLLRGTRYFVMNHNNWSLAEKPEPAQVFLMLDGNVLCCLKELGRELGPVIEAKPAEAKKPAEGEKKPAEGEKKPAEPAKQPAGDAAAGGEGKS